MKDYRVIVKVQNNYLFQAMQRSGITTAAELSRLAEVSQQDVGGYLNLKRTPVMRNGDYRPSIIKISTTLNTMITELFPEDNLINALDTNTATVEMNKEELLSITEQTDPTTLLELEESKEALYKVLYTLTEREQGVIKRRFGIGYETHTLEEVGEIYGLSRERVRSIECHVLRRLRNPIRSDVLRLKNKSEEFLDKHIKEPEQ